MWWLGGVVAWGAECDRLEPRLACACEEQRARGVNAALAAAGTTSVGRASDAAWRTQAQSTCAWVEGFSDGCVPTSTCVRLLAEDRLAMLSGAVASARAADLLRVTGRRCAEADKACVTDARTAEEERLAAVVEVLERAGIGPVEAQRYWHVYRDGSCDAEAVAGDLDRIGWSRAACGAVLAARRTEILATLGGFHDPETAAEIEEARWHAASARLRPRRRPWEAWLHEAGDGVQALVREGVEARVDGALFPPLVATSSWAGCAEPGASCLAAVHAETRARLEALRAAGAVPSAWDGAEAAWRDGWCGNLRDQPAREGCEAEIDTIVAAAAGQRNTTTP